MKLHKICVLLASAGMLTVAPGCKDFYNVNVYPLAPSVATLNLLLPTTQVNMAEYLGDNIGGMSQFTMALTQQLYNTRSIGNFQQTSGSFGGPWSGLYAGVLVNNEILITQGTTEQNWAYVGIAQLQKAYVFSQMVDLWGDIPYSEALKGVGNLTPRFDKDVDIYNGNGSIQGLFALIDEGIANLARGTSSPTLAQADLVYKGSLDTWASFGRTLKLKLYNQIRKTNSNAAVQAQVGPLLSGPLLSEGSDFQLAYSGTVNPDNRNQGFVNDYTANPENKIGRYFYEGMVTLKDPRLPYYFYNQIAKGITTTQQDYISALDPRFVTVRPGSTGPFASSASTASVQTVQGLYPVGGRYDGGLGGTVNPKSGKAQAPQRLLTYYSRKYTEAELQLMVYNNPAAARIALEEAIDASFRKVNVIAAADGSPIIPLNTLAPVAPSTDSIQGYAFYRRSALRRYDTFKPTTGPSRPTTTDEKLEVIMYEKYVASYGYGVDIYTDFRRTGHPLLRVSAGAADPARGLLPDDGSTLANGPFPRRLFYPTNDLLLNPNSPGGQNSNPIFWDK